MRVALIGFVALAMLPSIAADRTTDGDAPQFRGQELVRPDGYVAWADAGADPNELRSYRDRHRLT